MQSTLLWVFFDFIIKILSENKLQEVWIWTQDDGSNHHFVPEVYQYYTRITEYPFISLSTKSFNVSSRSYGGDCNHRFVLLSVAADLMSPEYYEIYFGPESIYFRMHDKVEDFIVGYGNRPTTCDEFLDLTVSWADDGSISVYNGLTGQTAHSRDIFPPVLAIQGVGIKTGFGNEGLWKFKHSGSFVGYFCTQKQAYGAMDILETTKARKLECAVFCATTNNCLGINYHSDTEACELLSSGKPVFITTNADWMFSSKCLDGHNLCQACIHLLTWTNGGILQETPGDAWTPGVKCNKQYWN